VPAKTLLHLLLECLDLVIQFGDDGHEGFRGGGVGGLDPCTGLQLLALKGGGDLVRPRLQVAAAPGLPQQRLDFG
jgi:hypothetical protein